MFGIGFTEILLILIVALVIIGPEKLPDLAKTIGKALNEFKRTTNDIKRTIEGEPAPRATHKSTITTPVEETRDAPGAPSDPGISDDAEEIKTEERAKKKAPVKKTVRARRVQKKKPVKSAVEDTPGESNGEGES